MIIEDEKIAAEYLEKMLCELDSNIDVIAKLDSVSESVAWLKNNQPDLIFMDIHLADDISFSIFDQTKVDAPVIFTTAFDQYAVRAFKVNSIDYLLKPIDQDELSTALDKFNREENKHNSYQELIQYIKKEEENTRNRFLVQRGSELISVNVSDVAYCYAEEKVVFMVTKDGTELIIDKTIEQLSKELPKQNFFRINRKMLVCSNCIKRMHAYSKSRVKLELNPPAKFDAIVSVERSSGFKKWLDQ